MHSLSQKERHASSKGEKKARLCRGVNTKHGTKDGPVLLLRTTIAVPRSAGKMLKREEIVNNNLYSVSGTGHSMAAIGSKRSPLTSNRLHLSQDFLNTRLHWNNLIRFNQIPEYSIFERDSGILAPTCHPRPKNVRSIHGTSHSMAVITVMRATFLFTSALPLVHASLLGILPDPVGLIDTSSPKGRKTVLRDSFDHGALPVAPIFLVPSFASRSLSHVVVDHRGLFQAVISPTLVVDEGLIVALIHGTTEYMAEVVTDTGGPPGMGPFLSFQEFLSAVEIFPFL
uniref:Uncharacterized protein n=1 Tax=Steinernema glaseri TaxID=37863 RepID=A0A1I8AUA0_9BILA